jgi:hypothetical protein
MCFQEKKEDSEVADIGGCLSVANVLAEANGDR